MVLKDDGEKLQDSLSRMLMGDSSGGFSERAMTFAYEPLNVGEIESPDGSASVTGSCGDRMYITLKLSGDTIEDARFLTDGCGATLACGSAVTEMAKGKTVFQAKKIYPQTIVKYLDGLPASHVHCAVLAAQTLWKALESSNPK